MPALDNPRHEAFAQALAQGKTADEAYVLAGFRANRGNASTLKANQSVALRVAALVEQGAGQAQITVTRVLQELTRIATVDVRKAYDAEGNLKPIAEWDDDLVAAVSSIEVVTRALPGEADEELDGQPHGGALKRNRHPRVEYVHKVRFWDKNTALDKIAKHLGMFIEKLEVTGRGGAPIEETVTVTHKLDKDSLQVIADLVR